MQDASHRKAFPFGLPPSSDAHARQVAKSIKIQSGQLESSGDLKIEPRARRDPLNVMCTYYKGTQHTLPGCRLRKKIDRERDASRGAQTPHLRMSVSSRRPGSASLPTTKDPLDGVSWWFQRTNHRGSAPQTPRRHVESKPT
jgi:hypothetical protein